MKNITTSRYANILLDYWFKRTFGSEINKRLMILLLREIIPEADVQDITYGNKEHPNPFPGSHGVIFDIECTASDGSRFIVEVQLARQKWFMERALYYSSFAIQEQLERSGDTYEFMPVYFIGLMDFSLHSDSDGTFMFNYELIEKKSGEPMTDRLKFIFLELPNVQSIAEDSSDLAKLCYALHNMTTERDIRNQIAYSKEEGKKEGMKEGIKEGLEQGHQALILTARKLVERMGLSVSQAAEATGLSPEEFMNN